MTVLFSFTRNKIKDIERQLKYEKLFSILLRFEKFKKEKNLLGEGNQSWIDG